jgi:hypothetical protein
MELKMNDKGEPGINNDTYAITIWATDNTLLYSSNWSGALTNEAPINGGNIQVRSSGLKSVVIESLVATANKPVIGNTDLLVYPNPFSDKLRFEFISPSDTHAFINLYDITGRMVQTVFDNEVKAGTEYNAEFAPFTKVSGMYIYRMTIGEEVFNGKVMYNQK